MKYVEIGFGYRLRRRDSANWELEQWRAADPNHHRTKSAEPKWVPLGRYYQQLAPALSAVYELVLRDPSEDGAALAEAVGRAERVAAELAKVPDALKAVS